MSVIHHKNDLAAVDTSGGWTSDVGPLAVLDTIKFNVDGGLGFAAFTSGSAKIKSPQLFDLASFAGSDGDGPDGSLITDAAGDLFGTTELGGPDGGGTVFEILKTKAGYESAPTTLAAFAGPNGASSLSGLIADAAGDLFGTTSSGGADGDGTVFEIVKTKHGYSSAPITVVKFAGANGASPNGSLIADAAGDLFGTTAGGGVNGDGTVFEVAKTKRGYASSPTTLVGFTGADGQIPYSSLITDAAGDLFGTTNLGGLNDDGTVFEIAKIKSGYASAPVTLVSFTGANGSGPTGALIADNAGNLFGTTSTGGADGDGTVYEIAKTKSGYASAPTVLVSFTGADGTSPVGSLIADAAGDLFGTTGDGGLNDDGTVFEIAKTKQGYASAPITLVNLNGTDGETPNGSLIADAAGNLFSATSQGGADGDGTVFEITHSGFVPPATPATVSGADIAHSVPLSAVFVQAMAIHVSSVLRSGCAEIHASRTERQTLLAVPHSAC